MGGNLVDLAMIVVGSGRTATGWLVGAACLIGTVVSGIRWLRIAQREHYLVDSTSRFALRWWFSNPLNAVITTLAGCALILASLWPVVGLVDAALAIVWPIGLSLRGRSSPLVWTRRLKVLASVWFVIELAASAILAFALGRPAMIGAALFIAPAAIDGACALTLPFENRLARGFVIRAAERLSKVSPKVVAITGSYGKTSTKAAVAHLLADTCSVVASPASFNNRAGLSRAVNEQLTDGTEVFVAEMGTYGVGEIADLCRWIHPTISVITAIGPVHLERFGTVDRIVEAKGEILDSASVAVLMVDEPSLAHLADISEQGGKKVWRCSSTDTAAQIALVVSPDAGHIGGVAPDDAGWAPGFDLYLRGQMVASRIKTSGHPGNLACALAVALEVADGPDVELGAVASRFARRLESLPPVDHRLQRSVGASGATVLDDTYNSNPEGAQAALELLSRLKAPGGRAVVVTPGMVELGKRQAEENFNLAATAASIATDLVIVGLTNRRALRDGAASHPASGSSRLNVVAVRHRQEAVEWVRAELGSSDVVLYENDLPDHYA